METPGIKPEKISQNGTGIEPKIENPGIKINFSPDAKKLPTDQMEEHINKFLKQNPPLEKP